MLCRPPPVLETATTRLWRCMLEPITRGAATVVIKSWNRPPGKLQPARAVVESRDAVTVDVTNSMHKSWNRQRNLFQQRETARRRLLEPSAKKCCDHAARKLQLAKTMATTVLQPTAQKKLLQRDAMAIVEEEKPVPAISCKRVEAF